MQSRSAIEIVFFITNVMALSCVLFIVYLRPAYSLDDILIPKETIQLDTINTLNPDRGKREIFETFSLWQFNYHNGNWVKAFEFTKAGEYKLIDGEIPEYVNHNSINIVNYLVGVIHGIKESYNKNMSVKIVASKRGNVIKEKIYKSVFFSKDGYFFAPIMLDDLSCDPIIVNFEIRIMNQVSEHKNITVNYSCSE